jgi:hypothetical protein
MYAHTRIGIFLFLILVSFLPQLRNSRNGKYMVNVGHVVELKVVELKFSERQNVECQFVEVSYCRCLKMTKWSTIDIFCRL